MANNNNNNQQPPFWEFVQSFAPHGAARAGAGIDHATFGSQFPQNFPFEATQHNNPWTGPPWGRWGGPWGRQEWHGRDGNQRTADSDSEDGHDHEHHDHEHHDHLDNDSSPETMRPTPDESESGDVPPPPPPPGAFPHRPAPPSSGAFPHPPPPPPGVPNHPPHGPGHRGHRHGFGHHRGRGGGWGRGGRRGHPAPPPAFNGPWDFRPFMHAFASHPFAQAFRDYTEQARSGPPGEPNEQENDSFTPPVDVFNTEKAYVLHVSLPGAVKEDVGVNWDGEKVNIAGVVYRPGNEQFLQSLTSSERKVGMFERSVKLPPVGSDEKDDVDGLAITAKMENGILIVTVPKVEKEWTEIHKVDIQ